LIFHDPPLKGALNFKTYEFLGKKHLDLLKEVHQRHPCAHEDNLAAEILTLLVPEVGNLARAQGRTFFHQWVKQHDGVLPEISLLDHFGSDERRQMEQLDIRWIGLAVLIAFVGGSLVQQLLRARDAKDSVTLREPRPESVPAPKPQTWRFAVAAFTSSIRNSGHNTSAAADVLTIATFWWVGPPSQWGSIIRDANLTEISAIPDTDDVLIILAYDVPGTSGGPPTSRTELAMKLRDAARRGELRTVGIFTTSDQHSLNATGFRR